MLSHDLPDLHGALSTWTELLELRLDASVTAESLCLRSTRRLCLPVPKNVRLLILDGEESGDALGDCDFLLLMFFLAFIKGIHTIFLLLVLTILFCNFRREKKYSYHNLSISICVASFYFLQILSYITRIYCRKYSCVTLVLSQKLLLPFRDYLYCAP